MRYRDQCIETRSKEETERGNYKCSLRVSGSFPDIIHLFFHIIEFGASSFSTTGLGVIRERGYVIGYLTFSLSLAGARDLLGSIVLRNHIFLYFGLDSERADYAKFRAFVLRTQSERNKQNE